MLTVWSPQSCTLDDLTHVWTLIELGADPTLATDHVKATGPLRTQTFDEITFAPLTAMWSYHGASFESEDAAIAAWQAWDPDALPPEPEPEP